MPAIGAVGSVRRAPGGNARRPSCLLLVPLVACLAACLAPARSQPELYHEEPIEQQPVSEERCPFLPRVELVLLRIGECPNWDSALKLARARACCDRRRRSPQETGGKGREDGPCAKLLPCNVCRFLEDGKPPSAFIVDLPDNKLFTEGASKIVDPPFPPGAAPASWIELKRSRCYGPGTGFWIFWEDNVKFLAEGMIHESVHQCRTLGAYGPSVQDPRAGEIAHECLE